MIKMLPYHMKKKNEFEHYTRNFKFLTHILYIHCGFILQSGEAPIACKLFQLNFLHEQAAMFAPLATSMLATPLLLVIREHDCMI